MLVERISAIHRDNYGVLGVRKMWHALYRDGIDIGREQTARLMRLAGGSGKGRSPITTRKPNLPDLRPDLVEREFKAQGPNKLWVADITYVRTNNGFVYTAFVFPTDRWVGVIRFHAHFRHCRCKLSTRRLCVLRKRRV
ncbi:IS3 family transposase [Corynebacterium diphtheriae]|nr:IS3 family transposase [Corynebacterium diphtheriae subsp. diphtheriae]UEB40089.1 IS3 family transposase [Corynebacterium diphtheriae]UEB42225.1 IS3 family transposase [Corynebacterium diphtheriae]